MRRLIIPADSAKWFIRQMRHFGLETENLLTGTGLDNAWYEDENSRIATANYIRIIKNGLDMTGDPALGLNIGKYINLAEFGVWGYAIMSCKTAREAMDVTLKYWELNGGLVKLDIKLSDEGIVWEISPAFPLDDHRLLIYAMEDTVSITYETCGLLFGKYPEITGLTLTYPKPAHADRYLDFTGAPIQFEASSNCIVMSKEALEFQTVTGYPGMKEVCEKQCQQLILNLEKADGFIEAIRYFLIESMGRFPNAAEVSQELGISPRTLFRRLRERNTSFQKILDDVRASLARDYLQKTSLSIDQISELIGFKETTTFRRSFKKWVGLSPTEFSRKMRSG